MITLIGHIKWIPYRKIVKKEFLLRGFNFIYSFFYLATECLARTKL